MQIPSFATPCVLVVADPERVVELVGALSEPLPTTVVSKIDVLVSSGGDDTIELFDARKPPVVVVTASLETGDPVALVEALREMAPHLGVGIVVIENSERGAVHDPLEAMDLAELAPDQLVPRPLSPVKLRSAVANALESVIIARRPARRSVPPPMMPTRMPMMPVRMPVTPPPIVPARKPPPPLPVEVVASTRVTLRRRWETLADSLVDEPDDELEEDISEIIDERELDDLDDNVDDALAAAAPSRAAAESALAEPAPAEPEPAEPVPDEPPPLPPPIMIRPRRMPDVAPPQAWRPGTTSELDHAPDPPPREPTLILPDAAAPLMPPPLPEVSAPVGPADTSAPLSQVDDELLLGHSTPMSAGNSGRFEVRLEVLDDLSDDAPHAPSSSGDGRDFARQLRAKMSQMAQRLFAGADAPPPPAPADLEPRHDHSTEFDLSSLGEELRLGAGAEIESRASARVIGERAITPSPHTWDSQVRERGLPEQGEIVRGVSDAAMLLAKMFASGATGRIHGTRDGVQTTVYLDHGRPVFASSNEPRNRMGELLVREGKITAGQHERCQGVVAESGRRMGEILVDFGYLKRRELLPAVRRHVEDIIYSWFGWERGHYQVAIDAQPCAERIRLSRHPASLILEGIRRKLDRATLERLLGPPSTVIEVGDRERLGGIINMGDLAPEERAALAAFDGQGDLAHVARAAGVDVADLLPLAWGLCVLGLAVARRTSFYTGEVHDESTALVGETDLVIDRERVRARWQLVTDADYFALLGVRRDATAFEIRRAYQSARRDFAADGFPSDLRRELAQELDDIANVLDEAFRVLRDDRLRQTYLIHLVE